MPKISVIMPVYNGERYLKEAIDSILCQSFRDFEFIIIDDGSKDSSADIVKGYTDERIRFYQNESNMGVARTLNKGIELARGEFIARMDCDDISKPLRFERQLYFLQRHSRVGVVGSGTEIFGEDIKAQITIPNRRAEEYKATLFFSTCIAHPAAMIRREALGDIRYEPEYEGLEDYVLWWRISEKWDIYSLKEVLFCYRKHKNQVTQVQAKTKAFCNKLRSFSSEKLALFDKSHAKIEAELLLKYSLGDIYDFTEDEIKIFVLSFKKILLKNGEIRRFSHKYLKQEFGYAVAEVIGGSIKDKGMKKELYQYARKEGVIGSVHYFKLQYYLIRER